MNKVILVGNVGADPDVRVMPDGVTKVAQVRLATTKRGYTKQDGTQVPDKTTWHTCIFWRKLAETVQQYVHKGDKIGIEGEYESREIVDKNDPNIKRIVYEVTVGNLEMLTPKKAAAPAPSPAPMPMAPPAAPGYNNQYAQTGQYAPAPAPAAPAPAPLPPHYAQPQQGTIPFQQQVAPPQAQQPVQAAPAQEWGNNEDLPF